MPRFAYFSPANSYIEPYSSSTGGGELVTEFNQRAGLNVIGSKPVYLEDGNAEVYAYASYSPTGDSPRTNYSALMTGTRDLLSMQLSISGANLRIAPGEAVVKGYYCNLGTELLIPTSEAITMAEMQDTANAKEIEDRDCLTRYVKVRIVTTQSPGNDHDERLVPPSDGVYAGFEIVIDKVLPSREELLLGILSRHTDGSYTVANNTLKARVVGINRISGAENYHNLVSSPQERDDVNIYGVQANHYEDGVIVPTENNITNINEWTWLGYNSVLGRYLRNMARVPDDAGKPGGIPGSSSLQMLGNMIGWAADGTDTSSYTISDATRSNKLVRVRTVTMSGIPILTYRVLLSGESSPDCYATEYVPLPEADYEGHAYPDDVPEFSHLIGRQSGVMSSRSLWQLDQLWADRDSLNLGRQFGPFVSKQAADQWFAQHVDTVTPMLNDYYWVLSDTVNNYADPTDTTVDYGTISTTFTCSMTGTVNIEAKDQVLTGQLTATTVEGSASGTATPNNVDYDPFPVSIAFTNGELSFPVTGQDPIKIEYDSVAGTVTGTGIATATAELKDFSQNVSARYVFLDDPEYPGDETKRKWQKQAVLRGFAAPADPNHYGFVKPSDGNTIGDVIVDNATGQLKLDVHSRAMLQNGGWEVVSGAEDQIITMDTDTSVYQGKWYQDGIRFILTGNNWDAESAPVLKRIRGKVTLITTNASLAANATAAINCEDIDYLVLGTDAYPPAVKVNTENCVVDLMYSDYVYRWINTRFRSGSNKAVVNNPWMTVTDAFSHTYVNSLQARFATITRGEYGIESAELDIWIKREDWTVPKTIEDFAMITINKLKFPPLYFTLNDDGQPQYVQLIPDDVNAKVSGTGGTHRTWDDAQSQYVLTGNWISTIDWENGQELSVNGRMICPEGDRLHGLHDIRFRALVQFTKADDMVEQSVDYGLLFPTS